MHDAFVPFSVLLLTCAAAFAQQGAEPPGAVPLPDRLAEATARATVHNKRVLLVLDARGEDLTARLQRTRSIARQLRYEFETVTAGKDEVPALAKQLQLPGDRSGIAVLHASGTLLSWIAATTFVSKAGGDAGSVPEIDGDTLLALLEPLFCAKANAEKKLADALVLAKKTGRNVFVRFDAPW